MDMAIFDSIKVNDTAMTEYRLMYKFGAWVTAARIYAESDSEAIFDADNTERIAGDKLQYALFCGNRKVKEY